MLRELFGTAVCIRSHGTRRQLKEVTGTFSLLKIRTLKTVPSMDFKSLCLFSHTVTSTVKCVNELQPTDEHVAEDNSCVKSQRPNGKPRHSSSHIPHERQFKSSQAVQILPCTLASGRKVNTTTCSSCCVPSHSFHSFRWVTSHVSKR